MKEQGIARRYAKALLEIAQKNETVQQTGEELAHFLEVVQSHSDLRIVFLSPLFDPEKRRQVVQEITKKLEFLPSTRHFLYILIEKDRTNELETIVTTYHQLADELEKRVRARVVSAQELSESYVEQLREKLGQLTGRTVLIEQEIDPGLISGVVTWVGHTVYDGSLRARLQMMQNHLLEPR